MVGSDGTTVASRLSYDPWGKATESGSGALSDFAYTGHHFDRATGLNLAQYRGYDAGLGRWLSRDPAGLRGGLNLYGYTENNPVNYIDPDGRWIVPVVAIVAIVVAYGYIFASDDAAAQREAHPEAASSPAKGLLLSAGVLAPVSALGHVGELGAAAAPAAAACGGGGAAAMDRARAACPGGDCIRLSQYMQADVGGKLVSLLPRTGSTLPTVAGLPNTPWYGHTGVLMANGTVADPLQGVTYGSVDAFRAAIVGNADVLIAIDGAIQ